MTKHKRKKAWADGLLFPGSTPHLTSNYLDVVANCDHVGDDFATRETSARAKQQTEIRAEFYLIFKCPAFSGRMKWGEMAFENIIALAYEPQYSGASQLNAEFWHDKVYNVSSKIAATTGQEQSPMLVLNIDGVEFVDTVLPVRLRLTLLNSSPDLFRGQLYKSTAQNVFLVVEPVNGELNVISAISVFANDRKISVIKDSPQIVDFR